MWLHRVFVDLTEGFMRWAPPADRHCEIKRKNTRSSNAICTRAVPSCPGFHDVIQPVGNSRLLH
eukprot:991986-Rhodomonas_salina.2